MTYPSRRRLLRSLGSSVVAFVGVVPCAASDTVKLTVTTVKQTVLVGEPVVLLVTINSTKDLFLEDSLTIGNRPFRVLVDRGQGFVPYRAEAFVSETASIRPDHLKNGQAILEYVLAYDSMIKDWVFPTPGTYRIATEYKDATLGVLRSNSTTVSVVAPTGDDKTVHDTLRRLGPESLGVEMPNRLQGPLAQLAAQYPRSVYLQELRLLDLDARHSSVANGYDPDDVEELNEDPPRQPDLRPDTVRGRLAALVPLGEELADIPGQFQADALLVLAGLYNGSGNEEAARQTYQRIVQDFPNRKAAKLALEEVGDTTPPTLQVSASPSTLWPPDHKLVLITVTVNVSDDRDPNPKVKLVSITCNDACNPTQDIVVTLNADTRSFQLRAERTGAGSGRTYAITYSATDASGNSTAAKTTVVVPHDQR